MLASAAASPLATFDTVRDFSWSLALVMARLLPLFILLPFTGRSLMPGMIRNSIAIALGVIVAPSLMPAVSASQAGGIFVLGVIVKEALLGLLLGFLAALPFWAVEASGFIIDNQRGASIAATMDPMTGHDTSPLGIMFNQAFITFFFLGGGFHLLLGLIYESYAQWHPLAFWPELSIDSAAIFIRQINRIVSLALLLGAAVLVAMFLAEVGLALISRFAPQLQVFILAMPIKSALAMLMLGIYVALLFDYTRPLIQEIGGIVDLLNLELGGGGGAR